MALSGQKLDNGTLSIASTNKSSRVSFFKDVLLFDLITFSYEKTRSNLPFDAGSRKINLAKMMAFPHSLDESALKQSPPYSTII